MKKISGIRLALLLSLLVSPAFAADSLLKDAVYCHALEENQSPKDKAEFFLPDQTIYLSVTLKGRPGSGIVSARFMFRDELIAEAKLDVAEVNKGIVFSIGQNTFAGFNLKPNAPLPVGELYYTEVSFDGKSLGKFPFRVDPPKDAIPSKVSSTTLARRVDDHSAPVEETHSFTSVDKVVLAGRGDLGDRTWLEAGWIVSGKEDPAATKSFTMEENKKDVPFYFSYLPKGGWPVGEHAVVLFMNGKEAARQTFTITAAPPEVARKITVSGITLHHDDGKGEAGEETKSFQPTDLVLHVRFVLAKPALAQGTQVAWTLVKAEGVEPQKIATASIEDEGMQNAISGALTTKKGLPEGSYRVDLLSGETVLATREFTVGSDSDAPSKIGGGLKKK